MRILLYVTLFFASFIQTTVIVNFLELIFIKKTYHKYIWQGAILLNFLITFFSTFFYLKPLLSGAITIVGWTGLLTQYRGKIKYKFLYLSTFFVVSAILESLSLLILGIHSTNTITSTNRIQAFIINTLLYVCAYLIFKYLSYWGKSKIRFNSVWALYLLPIISLAFDSAIFSNDGSSTNTFQFIIIIGSLLLALDTIYLANKFDQNYFEIQKLTQLNTLFQNQQLKLTSLSSHEKSLSLQVHNIDEALMKIYAAVHAKNINHAIHLIEKHFLTLNSGLVQLSNPQNQISIDLVISQINEICHRNDIIFINDIKTTNNDITLDNQEELGIFSCMFSFALDHLLKNKSQHKYFKIKMYQRLNLTYIFISFTSQFPKSQLSKLKFHDFLRKSFELQYINKTVKQHSGHLKLELQPDTFGLLIVI